MNKNWIGGLRCRASGLLTANPISIKGTGGKSSSYAWKAVELTSGGLRHVPTRSGLRVERFTLTMPQKSAAGIVVAKAMKAQTVRERQVGRMTR
jgi:hypothetical protein